MHLNVSRRKEGRVYLSIVKGYRDKDTGKNRTSVVESIGYVDELENKYPDPISHFRDVAKKMTLEEQNTQSLTMTIDMSESLAEENNSAKNLGYAVPLKVYHDLELDKFLKSKSRNHDFKYNTSSIMILLVISRILSPGSKKKAFDEKGEYFERFSFSLADVYRALNHFDDISIDTQRFIHDQVAKKYGSDTSIVYYDVTNYYFEIASPDDLRKYGKPKQNRKKPVVQMGLAMDKNGIPLHYELFPGNKLDKETFRSVIGEVRKEYDTGRIVVVADMGIITGDNINYLIGDKPEKPLNGYVLSFSVRGGTKEFKEYVLDESDYVTRRGKNATQDSDFKIKSRVIARDINVTMANGKTKKRKVYEKQVVFFSRKYQEKSRAERAEVIAKAMDLVSHPKKYNRATAYGAASYVDNLKYVKNTGEIVEENLKLNHSKIDEDEKYDGYYSIITSELDMSDYEMIDTYRGLWEIEETFKITKSDLESRPVYVSNEKHINAHFLTCFIALTILRLVQQKVDKQYSASEIISCLNNIRCVHEYDNIYLFGYRSKLSDLLGKTFGIDFSRKRLRLDEIKKLLADTKR